ncbi:hypothetical protein BDV93DRAFT_523233 [Ceratobasidium sp. AG-I]|nr:hypothetical protein BDV93DRAFT_523233 [Ceratobasidium sp. AG-I]
MSYRYEAASGYQARRARSTAQPAPSTSSHYRAAYSAAGPSVSSRGEDNSHSTRQRWQAAQTPSAHTPVNTRTRGVRFAQPGEAPSSAYLHPNTYPYGSTMPASPNSAYMSSPRAPSLSHSTDGEYEDDMECPPTPEHHPIPLPQVDAKVSRSHQAAYSTINQITHEMNSLVRSFQLPHDLEFESAPSDRHAVPKLTFASKNRGLLEQNQKLERLQTRLDAVESHGDSNVRKARKDAVAQIERALEDLKRAQAMVWNKHVYEQRKKRHA